FAENKDSSQIMAPSSMGLNDPMLNNLIQELTALNAEKQRIISQNQLKNPRLTTLNNSIDNLKDVIAENIRFSLQTTRREIQDLNASISNLNAEFSSLPQTQRELLGIERRFKLNDATYTSLLEKRLQAQIIKASKLPDAKVIEPPIYMGISSPKRSIILILALMAGIGIPSLIILLKKLIDNRIATKEDVEMISPVPVIASIPNNRNSEENVVMNFPRTPLAEAFHSLRSNVVYYLHGENKKVILVTSSMPDEGKSFSSINLAASFALASSKTVLVEFDLRNPGKFAEVFGEPARHGISSYLINKASLEDIVQPTKQPNLDVVFAGQVPPNPVELISGSRTPQLMQELKEKYDFVIVDTPPFGLLTDSFLLMNYSDLNLFISRIGVTRKNILSANLREAEQKKINKLYVVVNDVKADLKKYGKYVYLERERKKSNFFKKKIAVLFSF
ncbi:MAG: polysaccharide biosynthesis tyrosine autokinase, partial [Bacteroidales bacterium]